MDMLRSNKQEKKLSLNVYMYVVKVRMSAKIRWECWRRKTYGCNGSVYTDMNDENPDKRNEHYHPPVNRDIKFGKSKDILKVMVKTSTVKPSSIIS